MPWPSAARWLLAALGWVGLAVALTWPLALRLDEAIPGFLQVDQMDTAWLRLSAARLLARPGTWPVSPEIDAPTGYPLAALVPNWLDHLTGAPFALWLPWPVGDDLWWILALAANGLAAHVLGQRLTGSHAAGVLCGVLFATSEPVLREANLHHAPQVLLFASPLYVLALVRTLERPDLRWAAATGGFMALAALTYWYQALFLALLSLPAAAAALASPPALLARFRESRPADVVAGSEAAGRRAASRPRELALHLALAAAVTVAVCALPLAAFLAHGDAVPNPAEAPPIDPRLSALTDAIPAEHRWTFAHGADPLWPLRRFPLDRANRLSLVLVAAAVLGGVRAPGRRWPWVVAAALAGVLLMGPYLKWGEDPVLVGGNPVPLPGLWLASASEWLARLTWPQRWGVVVPLALLPLAAYAPRPAVLAVVAVLEAFAVSGNAPLRLTTVAQFDGWRSLADAEAILVLPLDRAGPKAPAIGFVYRAAGRPLAAPMDVPPGAARPEAWEQWRRQSRFAEWWAARSTGAAVPLPGDALDQLVADGIDVIALDATPGVVPRDDLARRRRILVEALGEPVDYGSALAWWLDPPASVPPGLAHPDAWRERWRQRLADEPAVDGTIIRPVRWGSL